MKSLNKWQASMGAPTKSSVFMFVPVVQKLPIKSIITEEVTALEGKPNQNFAVSHEEVTEEIMSDGDFCKAEIVYIKESEQGGAGNTIQPETTHELKPSLDLVGLPRTSPAVSARSENTPKHEASWSVSMETTVNKHRGISQQQCRDTSGRAKVSSGYFANKAPDSEDRTSPTNSANMFPTPASSRESILSEGSDKDKSWSALQGSDITSPVSFSRTVSPCSSVLSGIFSPAVIQIKRHVLAPGSSLIHIPQTCFSSCESLSSAVGSRSPPPRHRPPLTRLSLLTAILRKGRLPVLSPSVQRPYTPCWPVNPVTLSFCNACSAASSLASIPLEFSTRCSSSASIDSQNHVHREPDRCATASPPVQAKEHNRTFIPVKRCSEQLRQRGAPRWEQVASPPPVKSNMLPRAPLHLFCSKFNIPPNGEEITNHTTKPESPDLKPGNAHMYLRGQESNNFKKLTPPSPKCVNEQKTSKISSREPYSSLSKLHWLSDQLRSPSPFTPHLPHSRSRSASGTSSPLPSFQTTTGSCESARSASQASLKAHGLSPSRYTPIAFSGWPSPTCSPTPTPSPAPPIRDFTPPPSLSVRSTPSPRPGSGISDCSDREGKKRKPHKIKSSYKSLAAIPTNTLLLDQQAIDEQVEREDSQSDTMDRLHVDTHAEMCSPAQLRQQSEELYATIDEILADSIPAVSPASKNSSRTSTTRKGLQQTNSSFPKSLGRETKYASLHSLHPPAGVERRMMDPKKTKPGVIRPMTAIPRLTVEEEEYHHNPFRQFVVQHNSTDNKKMENTSLAETERGKNGYTSARSQTFREERKPERRTAFSLCDLQITETEDQSSQPRKESSNSFRDAAGRTEVLKTHY